MNLTIAPSLAAHAIAHDSHASEVQSTEVPSVAANSSVAENSVSMDSFDRLNNAAIQQLMSQLNQAETLSSNLQKKLDDTISGQQQKIG